MFGSATTQTRAPRQVVDVTLYVDGFDVAFKYEGVDPSKVPLAPIDGRVYVETMDGERAWFRAESVVGVEVSEPYDDEETGESP